MAKKKKWSRRILERAREIIEFNMQNPMVRGDARELIPGRNIKNRGLKIDPNTLIVLHLRHHRPALFWDATISWKKLPPVSMESVSEWCYDLFRVFLFEDEIKAGEWDFFPANMSHPMVTVVTPYLPQESELVEYDNLVRERQDHEKFDLNRLMGKFADVDDDGGAKVEDTPSGGKLLVPTPDEVRQLG